MSKARQSPAPFEVGPISSPWRKRCPVLDNRRLAQPGIREYRTSVRLYFPLFAPVLAIGWVPFADAADATFLRLAKGTAHRQTGADSHQLMPGAWQFEAAVTAGRPGSILAATVTPPGRPETAMRLDDMEWWHGAVHSSEAALDDAYPPGTYTIRVTGQTDGVQGFYQAEILP
ncbi:MAG: hypothetical protein KF791_08020 [Verrucomicrobiae bacterium]|nr:hypothetical protein [Verrucomicrobiae bacterium]